MYLFNCPDPTIRAVDFCNLVEQNLIRLKRVEAILDANGIGTYQRRSVRLRIEHRFSPGQ